MKYVQLDRFSSCQKCNIKSETMLSSFPWMEREFLRVCHNKKFFISVSVVIFIMTKQLICFMVLPLCFDVTSGKSWFSLYVRLSCIVCCLLVWFYRPLSQEELTRNALFADKSVASNFWFGTLQTSIDVTIKFS